MSYPKPTPEMLKWHDYEVGLFFHYDIEVFEPEWRWDRKGPLPDAKKWNPVHLDTDQWARTAAAAGARYALLTAKHGTGFCLWPTKVHDYHVGNAGVTRDVVGEFVASCRKYGIAPGLYYSLGGAHLTNLCTDESGVLDREKLNAALLAQLEELLVGYGPLCEIWFDGGVRRPEKGGPDIPGVVNRLQPNLVCFGGPPGVTNILRWSGSEQGVAVPECWSTAHWMDAPERDNVTCDSPGDPDDPLWAPVEVDIPSRDVLRAYCNGWMYIDGDERSTYSGDYLFSRYLTSVGRNANLLIGAVPNRQGLISEDQVSAFSSFGDIVRKRLGVHLGQSLNMIADEREAGRDAGQYPTLMEVWFDEPIDATFIEIQEDQSDGQKVLEWVAELRWPRDWCEKDRVDQWIPLAYGQSIGHKRIIQLNLLRGYAFRVRILKAREGAKLTALRVYGQRVYDQHK
ncbi:MAG: alpha-L-fucosidase [Oscillospiraceae bacterium]|nr:alpha-L-fucosidase [Oscillospiraceae bacterium]